PLGPPLAPWGYTGEWEDPTGLVYLRARWYSAGVGRFTSVDPLPGLLAAPESRHPYAYGLASPTKLADPSGCLPVADGAVWPVVVPVPPRYPPPAPWTWPEPDIWMPQRPNDLQRAGSAFPSGSPEVWLAFEGSRAEWTFEELAPGGVIDPDAFLALQEAVYEDLYALWPPPAQWDLRRYYWDTAFWNAREPDTLVMYKGQCYKRSEVNYFAQGMFVAATGGSLEQAMEQSRLWKQVIYREVASSGVLFWTVYGYHAYERINAERQRESSR
ncbi:MAG: RHS repeat-associated core domain-containing protein, partial [Anaerolineae bacterium]|nr:RHS repeat-associated core domain-containing protein [Anaerolineae bacterium]